MMISARVTGGEFISLPGAYAATWVSRANINIHMLPLTDSTYFCSLQQSRPLSSKCLR